MEAMLAPIDAPLLAALQFDTLHLDVPLRMVDVACGGGGTTLELARVAPAGSHAVGVDISPGLIETARGRVSRETGSLSFVMADVAKAPPPGGPFDRLVSRFGVMFFAEPVAAFENLATWLVPGGRFAFAVWGPIAENPLVSTLRAAVSEHLELPPPMPDAPGPFRYGQVDVLLGLLERAGFGGLEVSTWRGALAVGGGLAAPEATEFALAALSIAEVVKQADEATQRRIRETLTMRFSQHLNGGVVQLGASVHIVTGTR
jgi:SAM-dependent methyltransferase